MNVKEQLLFVLENNRGENISGAELARKLSVSRNAVWKAVKSLQEEGYSITSALNKGYCLSNENDIISVQSIAKYLNEDTKKLMLEVHKEVTSTNSILKEYAEKGEQEGKVIVAEKQSSGRGRMNRSFYSPEGTGIYLSILLKPNLTFQESLLITTTAAVAVAEAIEKVSGCEAKIKWVNDIYCKGKKVCGILTEASLDMESGALKYAVLGIGINVLKPAGDFPEELKDIAAAVFDAELYSSDARSLLAAEVLNNFWKYYKKIGVDSCLGEYRKRSFLIGKDIYVISGSEQKKAKAIDIDEQYRLIVKLQDGSIEPLSSGEVSVKKIPS
jgi:BirA family biotin operon repressor/biotin-[acetyl-CoA-carboxylase] ligase